MATGQDTILNTDTVRDALKTKVNDDMTELFAAVAALVAGSGVLVSVNDTTIGYLNGKLLAGEGIDLTEGNDGADETLTIDGEDASDTNKGVASFSSRHFEISSGAVTADKLEALAFFHGLAFS